MKTTESTLNTIAEVKATAGKLPVMSDRKPVIVISPNGTGMFYYGIQFWTDEMIQSKESTNTDKSVSRFVEVL